MTQSEHELVAHARLARAILRDGTPYLTGKSLITAVFNADMGIPARDQVMLRLTVIDSYYGTNMGKRYYGIDDIADGLLSAGIDDDRLRKEADGFLVAAAHNSHRGSILSRLFTRRFGLTKKGESAGKAASLISKYLYFLCQYGFPIYDRLAVESLLIIVRRWSDLRISTFSKGDPLSYFFAVLRLNEHFGDLDLLDNLLWLIGKVREGNLSLVLSRERFNRLREVLSLPMTAQNVKDAARSSTDFRSAVSEALCRFILFVTTLE